MIIRDEPRFDPKLNDTWLKAAALGCLWASTEITIGGFLHNMRIPLAGNIMAAVGIIMMISVGILWPVKGLFWRAGLICALMKSLSPSAVIFGPMIAITCQAGLMELSVRVFRRHAVSYLVGAMMAMSWNMAQFLISTLLVYGSSALDVYQALVFWAQKILGFPPGQVWLPVMLMLLVQLVFGLLAGCLGLRIGYLAAKDPLRMSSLSKAQVMAIRAGKTAPFPFSAWWLLINIILLVLALVLASFSPWFLWLSLGLAVICLWAWRYRHGIRSLIRIRFWIWFVAITVLSGALLGSMKQGGWLPGLLTGLSMNFRAAVLLFGFSALGTELRSPSLGRHLSRGRFSQLPAALEAAVETLPWVLANLPRLSETFNRPIDVFRQVVAQAGFWLKRLTLKQARRKNVFLLTGQVGQGKSGMVKRLVDDVGARGAKVAGILSPSVYRAGQRIGYDLVDLVSGKRCELSRVREACDQEESPRVGGYTFHTHGIEFGLAALSLDIVKGADLVFVDEVGPWELCDQGWASALYELTLKSHIPMIWVSRSDIINQVSEHWGLEAPLVAELAAHTPDSMLFLVREWLAGVSSPESALAKGDNPPASPHPG